MKLLQSAAYHFASDAGKAQMIAQWAAQLLQQRGYIKGQVGDMQAAGYAVSRHRYLEVGSLLIQAQDRSVYGHKGPRQVAEQVVLTIAHQGLRVFDYSWSGERHIDHAPRLIRQPVTSGQCALHVHGDWVEDLYAQLARRKAQPPVLFRP